MSKRSCIKPFMLAVSMFSAAVTFGQQKAALPSDRLMPLQAGASRIEGYLGGKIDLCIRNGIMGRDFNLYLKPFMDRNDDPNKWQGEFWGKWFTSAALAHHYAPVTRYREIIDEAAAGLVKTQDDKGKLSTYTNDFGDWDIWGRKYAILGLVAHYDETGDKRSLAAAARSVDNLI